MAKFVKEIGTGEIGIAIDKGPKIQIIAVNRPIVVRLFKFVLFIEGLLLSVVKL